MDFFIQLHWEIFWSNYELLFINASIIIYQSRLNIMYTSCIFFRRLIFGINFLKSYNNNLHQVSECDTFGNIVQTLCLCTFCFLNMLRKTFSASFKACFGQISVKFHWSVSDCLKFYNYIRDSTSFIIHTFSIYFNTRWNRITM